ncbi:MAG: hypothetical protein AAF849_14930 [Bacteroidota bacterium]
MRYSIYIITVFFLSIVFSCTPPANDSSQASSNSQQHTSVEEATKGAEEINATGEEAQSLLPDESQQIVELPESHDCTIDTEVYEGNQQWFRGQSVLVAITADESTFDESLGVGHRLLVAYDTEDCSEIFKEILPVSVSADYPYYLTPVDSLKGELVGILGADRFFIYDVANNRLSKALNPKFRGNRELEDAQSGAIIGMETWGRYVIGYAEDKGSFVYNMTIPETPKQETAFAEYKQSDGSFASLYLLKEQEDNVQAVLPEYDLNERVFRLNPLMKEAAKISQQINKNALNNRYIVLRMQNENRTPVAIDMEKSQRISLPDAVQSKSTQEILEWVKKNS